MNVLVLGAGIMGSGIGQLAAMSGHRTTVRDIDEAQLARGTTAVERSLSKLVERGRLDEAAAADAGAALEFTLELDAATDAHIVIEAVPEVLEVKQAVLREVVDLAPDGAVFGSNTSQLSIASIGAGLPDGTAGRLVGTHFFNPPVLMRLVELVRGLETTDDTLRRAREFATGLGREVVVCAKDSPGFITSRAYAILRLECLRMAEEGVASFEDIDTAMRLGFNLPMGPFELGDLNGLDTYLHALDSLCEAYGDRFRPTVGLRNLVASGRLGRKAGAGFYDYGTEGG